MNISCGVFFLLTVLLPEWSAICLPSTNLSLPQLNKSVMLSSAKDFKLSRLSGSFANYITKKTSATAEPIRIKIIFMSSCLRSKESKGLKESIMSFESTKKLGRIQKSTPKWNKKSHTTKRNIMNPIRKIRR